MYESTQDATWVHGIDLAQEPDFELGSLHVRPAKCEVEWNGTNEILQRRVMQVLVALAHARGSVVSQDDLVMRCWRGLSVSDDAIFRCISKLRKLAAAYPDAPFAIETIPGVGYRLTSSSLAEENSTVETAAARGPRFRLGALETAVALAILVLLGAAIWIDRAHAPSEQHPIRVAVQPFEVLNDSGEARSLARIIPNEVVDALGDSQVEGFMAGEQADKARGGKSPEAGLIVTGIVRESGTNASVDVRIEDGSTHAALWSTEFKRDSKQSSDLPLEVAARVADVVNMAIFARTANPPLTDDSALSGLLQAADMMRDTNDDRWAQLLERAKSVVARYPNFAFGHSMLAAAYAEAAENISPDRAQAMSDAARREANLTLKLDPEDAGAYTVLAGLPPHDYRTSELILLRGIKFAKHPKEPFGALYAIEGTLLANVGLLREALSYQLIAQATDQWSPAKMTKLTLIYADMGNLPAARDALQKAVQRWPNSTSIRAAQRYVTGFYEPPSNALAAFDLLDAESLEEKNQDAVWRTFIEAKAAHAEQLTAVTVSRIREAADQGKISRENEIMMLADLGETRQAIEAANSALDHQGLRPGFLFTPVTRNLRQDPGFVPLAGRMGLIKYWREAGKRPDFCTDQASRNECSPQLLAALKS